MTTCPKCLADNPADSRFCRKCATPLPTEEDPALAQTKTLQMPTTMLERGTIFAERYEIIEELGKGGMGRVYKVYDNKIKEVVALKLIRPDISADENTIERFNNELRLARRISHRHVCRMYDVGEEGPSHFITMEYVPGEDLKRFIKRSGQLTVGKAVSIARQICEGLSEAHHLDIIHRDLKPQNIMIDENGNTRIMDFGIARFLEGEGMTTQGVMIGTPDYMAPEQVEMEGVDQRADIYALGVILFEMVTGRLPFKCNTPLSVAMKHKNQAPPDPRDLNIQVTEDLRQVILRCLEKEKDQRFLRIEDLLADLKNIEEGLPTTQKIIPKAKPQPSDKVTVTFNKKKFFIPALFFLAVILAFIIRFVVFPIKTEVTSQETAEIAKPPEPPKIKAGMGAVATKKEADRSTQIIDLPRTLRGFLPKDLEKVIDPSAFRGEMQFLGRAFSILSPNAMKLLDEEDLKGFDNLLVTIKDRMPEEGSQRIVIDQIRDKLKEGKKLQDAGKLVEAEKSYLEGQSQMRMLMESVRQKERADRAKDSMEQTQRYASERVGKEEGNLLYTVAEKQVNIAADSYKNGDFAGAGTLYDLLEKIFTYSVQGSDDAGSIEILKNFVGSLRTEVDIAGIPASASWLYEKGIEEEERARKLAEKKDYERAAETYIQAAFLYEKVQEEIAKNRYPLSR